MQSHHLTLTVTILDPSFFPITPRNRLLETNSDVQSPPRMNETHRQPNTNVAAASTTIDHSRESIGLDKQNVERKIVNMFLPISFNI